MSRNADDRDLPGERSDGSTARDEVSERNRVTYDRIAKTFRAKTRNPEFGLPWIEALVRRVGRGARVADLGCGPGRDSAILRSLGADTVSMDFSLGMLRAGQDDFEGPRVQGDLRHLPFANDVFEGAWVNASLLHLDPVDLDVALAEIARVVCPGGWLSTSVKGGSGDGWEDARYAEPRWFQFWSEDAFDARLARAGFDIHDADYDETRSQPWILRQARLRP